jgi:hypothetical protein
MVAIDATGGRFGPTQVRPDDGDADGGDRGLNGVADEEAELVRQIVEGVAKAKVFAGGNGAATVVAEVAELEDVVEIRGGSGQSASYGIVGVE